MFTPSTTTISAAIDEICDSAGVSADTGMRTRALRSLAAGIKYLNGRFNWSWLLTEGTPITVVAPFQQTLAASAGQTSATAASHSFKPDDLIVGSGFALGTRVVTTATTSWTFSQAITGFSAGVTTATVSGIRDFYDLPTDWKQPYTFRLLKTNSVIYPMQRRAYDRGIGDELSPTTPCWYDLFAGIQKGKVRLLPPPNATDTLMPRYYRRMTVPTDATATTVLDIPQDYDYHLIAWSKWHFLTDKGQPDRAQTWMALAKEGLSVMVSDQTRQPDETLAFLPREHGGWYSIDSTRSVPWDYTT